MRVEYGEDEGVTAAKQHRDRLVKGSRKLRAETGSFDPDFILIWGDDRVESRSFVLTAPGGIVTLVGAEGG